MNTVTLAKQQMNCKRRLALAKVSPVKQLDALKGLLARSAAAGAVVLVLQPPMGLPCTAKVLLGGSAPCLWAPQAPTHQIEDTSSVDGFCRFPSQPTPLSALF